MTPRNLTVRIGAPCMGNALAERGTSEFYREQAARLTALAATTATLKTRFELLDIATVFQKLADRVAINQNRYEAIEAQSA